MLDLEDPFAVHVEIRYRVIAGDPALYAYVSVLAVARGLGPRNLFPSFEVGFSLEVSGEKDDFAVDDVSNVESGSGFHSQPGLGSLKIPEDVGILDFSAAADLKPFGPLLFPKDEGPDERQWRV
ncbi:unnamed protein product [Cuscuta campestris]|uniref:Uncharacterized protein n=1 Tax=Cuscuta campestris TaxID=132261 RepID=A0A484KXR0_9ASTE|nr:unnamed protein product [Cuscuta campestris]